VTVVIYGVGTSRFGRQPERSPAALTGEAVLEALDDAGVETVDAVFLGTVYGEMGVAQRVLHRLGIMGVPVVRVENACASGTTAFHEAASAVRYGRYRSVLAVGVEHLTSLVPSGAIEPEPLDIEGRAGLALPALYAMAATRYLECNGLTREQMACVPVKNRANGANNPRAHFQASVSLEDVLSSRPIADPLRLLECSPISDGAGAAVIGAPRGNKRDIGIRASSMTSGELWDHRGEQVWGFDIVRRTARNAYEEARVSPQDIDVFEVHDAFSIGEIVTTEALGLAEIGGGGELVESGATERSGRSPVNPSGGLLSRGHPLGATGLAQVAEVVWQLRGDAAARQVDGAQLGLVETMGGGVSGIDGNACVVAVLERTDRRAA
jgi:acetyl-CoA acetyltransferase